MHSSEVVHRFPVRGAGNALARAVLAFGGSIFFLWIATSAARAGEICADPFTAAGLRHGVSPKLLYAIALHESGLRPLALNVDGAARFPASRTEALKLAAAARKNVDVGLMQVSHTIWRDDFNLSLADLLNPFTNVQVAAQILRSLFRDSPGDMFMAIGRYHTGRIGPAREYSRDVLRRWAGIRPKLEICWSGA